MIYNIYKSIRTIYSFCDTCHGSLTTDERFTLNAQIRNNNKLYRGIELGLCDICFYKLLLGEQVTYRKLSVSAFNHYLVCA